MNVRNRPINKKQTLVFGVFLLLMAIVFLSMATNFLYREFVYSMYAKTVDATVTHLEVRLLRGTRNAPSQTVLFVEYAFRNDAGQRRNGQDTLPSGSNVARGQSVEVESISGSEMSRVVGSGPSVIFCLSTGLLGVLVLGMAWLVFRSLATDGVK